MDHNGWPQPQNPNPNPALWQPADYSAYNHHHLNADPFRPPYIPPHTAMIPPHHPPPTLPPPHHIGPPGVDPTPYVQQQQIGPPGVDPTPYVQPPQVPVQYPPGQAYCYELPPSSATIVPGGYYPDPNANWTGAVCQFGAPPVPAGVATPHPAINPQRKNPKRKVQKKVKVAVKPAWCEVCRIDCNSSDVLDQHKLGKKHRKNFEKLKRTTVLGPSIGTSFPFFPAALPGGAPPTTVASSTTVVATTPGSDAALSVAATPVAAASSPVVEASTVSASPAVVAPAPAIGSASPAVVAPTTAIGSATTPVVPAAVTVTETDPVIASAMHLLHPNSGLINPDTTVTSSAKKSRKKKAAARIEDMEAKRRKVLEGGAPADSVRACNICNVVCNSDIVFNFHLAGQRHASMVKKQASRAGIASAT